MSYPELLCLIIFVSKSVYVKLILINEGDSMTYADIMSKIKTEISGIAVLLLLRTFTSTLHTLIWMDTLSLLLHNFLSILSYSTAL